MNLSRRTGAWSRPVQVAGELMVLTRIFHKGTSERARFDSQSGLVAGYGVPALAGKVLLLEGGSKHW